VRDIWGRSDESGFNSRWLKTMFGGDAMWKVRFAGLLLLCLVAASFLFAQSGHLTATEAKNHIGEKATVCGNVVSTHA